MTIPLRGPEPLFATTNPMTFPAPTPSHRPEVDVVAGILWRGDRFLAVRRPQGKPLAGYWEFPGGKVEAGEDFLTALARELREELGVSVQEAELLQEKQHEYDHLKVRLHFFRVNSFSGAPVSLEGQTLAWLTPRDAFDYPFLPADAEIVRRLLRRSPAPTHNQ